MNPKNLIVRSLTVLLFLSLITAFVSYRAGFWGNTYSFFPGSPNGGALNNSLDSTARKDSGQKEILPSSKTMLMRDFKTRKVTKADSSDQDTATRKRQMLSSSKSAMVVTPEMLKRWGLSDSMNKNQRKDSMDLDSLAP